jgi:hypothetical protein
MSDTQSIDMLPPLTDGVHYIRAPSITSPRYRRFEQITSTKPGRDADRI